MDMEWSDIPTLPSRAVSGVSLRALPGKITRMLSVVALLALALSVVGQCLDFGLKIPRLQVVTNLFNVDWESSFPTWFSSSLLLLCAVTGAGNAACARKFRERTAGGWGIFTALLFLFSMDEMLALHERLNGPLRAVVGNHGIFYYSWVAVGGLLVLALALASARFVAGLPVPVRRLLVLSGLLYFGGAIGIEIVGGLYSEQFGPNNLPYTFIATLEEGLEMFGIIILLRALLLHFFDLWERLYRQEMSARI
jgi:hypothetical protein